MKFGKILFALSLGIFFGLTNAQEESLYGCIYTCGRVGTTTDASSICAATHITINLDARITNEREARDACRNMDSTGYESAKKFCTEGIRRCNAPASDSAIVILNRRISEEERKAMNTNY